MTAPFDLQGFIAFCRSKPADEAYPSLLSTQCALAQFGFPGLASVDCTEVGVPPAVYRAAVLLGPFTFGALASRLAKLESE